MKCKLIRELRCDPSDERPDGRLPVGTVISDPLAWVHIRNGNADPADDEAESFRQTNEERQRSQHAFDRTSAGIQPEDFAAYDAGEMLGYDSEGEIIPGPNALPPEPSEFEEMFLQY